VIAQHHIHLSHSQVRVSSNVYRHFNFQIGSDEALYLATSSMLSSDLSFQLSSVMIKLAIEIDQFGIVGRTH